MTEAVFINSIGWTLIHSLWELTALAVIFYLLLRALRNHAPQYRYYLSLFFMMISLSVTSLTFILIYRKFASISLPDETIVLSFGQMVSPAVSEEVSGWWPSFIRFIQSGIPSLTYMYMIGVGLLMVRMGINFGSIRRLKKNSEPIDSGELPLPEEWIEKMNLRRKIRVRSSLRVQMPMVIGAFRPVILIPVAMLCHTSPDLLRAVLAHELAHIRRHDFLINLVQSVIETLFFYHPAVWYFSCMARREREFCCDLLAVEAGCDRADLARALTEAGSLHQRRQLSLQLSGSSDDLLNRVKYLLGFKPSFHFVPDHSIWYYGSLMGLFLLFSIGKNHLPRQNDIQPLTMDVTMAADTIPEHGQIMENPEQILENPDTSLIPRDASYEKKGPATKRKFVFRDTIVRKPHGDTIPMKNKVVIVQSDGDATVIINGDEIIFHQKNMEGWEDSLRLFQRKADSFIPDRKSLDSLMSYYKNLQIRSLNSRRRSLDSLWQQLPEFRFGTETLRFSIPDSLYSFSFTLPRSDGINLDSLFSQGRFADSFKGSFGPDSLFFTPDSRLFSFFDVDSLISYHLQVPSVTLDGGKSAEIRAKSEELRQLNEEIRTKEKELMELRREQQRKYREEMQKMREDKRETRER